MDTPRRPGGQRIGLRLREARTGRGDGSRRRARSERIYACLPIDLDTPHQSHAILSARTFVHIAQPNSMIHSKLTIRPPARPALAGRRSRISGWDSPQTGQMWQVWQMCGSFNSRTCHPTSKLDRSWLSFGGGRCGRCGRHFQITFSEDSPPSGAPNTSHTAAKDPRRSKPEWARMGSPCAEGTV